MSDSFDHLRRLCCDALDAEPVASTWIDTDGKLHLNATDSTRLYGLVQCALVGPCAAPRPPLWASTRARWQAWSELGEMEKEKARAAVVEFVRGVHGYKPSLPAPAAVWDSWVTWLFGSHGPEDGADGAAEPSSAGWDDWLCAAARQSRPHAVEGGDALPSEGPLQEMVAWEACTGPRHSYRGPDSLTGMQSDAQPATLTRPAIGDAIPIRQFSLHARPHPYP